MSHLGARLSALLDGELGPDEGRVARRHLGDCTECRAELDRIRAVRAALRALPPVEPPAGFVTDVVGQVERGTWRDGRRRATPRLAAVGLVASLAVSAVLVALGSGALPSSPVAPVGAAVEGHGAAMAAMAAEGGDGIRLSGGTARATLAGWRSVAATDVGAPYAVPAVLDGGYELAAAFRSDDGLHAVYRRHGDEVLSLMEVPGRIDWDGLPAEGRTTIDGSAAWSGHSGRWTVVLVERDGLVQAAVAGEASGQVARALASAPPPRDLSLGQRFRRACQQTLADLGLLST